MASCINLCGADVVGFQNGDVSITGTTPGFVERSLIREKGVKLDWLGVNYGD